MTCREVEKVVLPNGASVRAAQNDAMNGTVGSLHELAEKYGGYVVYTDDKQVQNVKPKSPPFFDVLTSKERILPGK